VSLVVGDPIVPKAVEYALGTAEFLLSATSSAGAPETVVRTASFQPVNNVKPEIVHMFVSHGDLGAGTRAAPFVSTARLLTHHNVCRAHVQRAPEKRPPAVVSLAFSALAFVPLAAVLVYVPVATGANFKVRLAAGRQGGCSHFVSSTARLLVALGFRLLTGFCPRCLAQAWPVASGYAILFHAGLAGMLVLYVMFWLKLNLAQTLPLAAFGGLFVAASGYLTLSTLAQNRLKKD
jgi:oligosaccharyltransferase complex subunit delta (ribophorin II)